MDKTKLFILGGFALVILPFAYGVTTLRTEPHLQPAIVEETPPLPDPVYLNLPVGVVTELPGTGRAAEVGFTFMVERSAPQRVEIEAMIDNVDEKLDALLSEAIRHAVEDGASGADLLRAISLQSREQLNIALGTDDYSQPIFEVLVTSFQAQ